MSKNSALYLIPTPIGEGRHNEVLPSETLNILPFMKHFIVENLRSARRFLKAAGYPHDFDNVWFYEISEHNQFDSVSECLKPLADGFLIGLISEAGIPCVADPGFTVVRMAHERGVRVVPLGGPSSVMKALMASGLSGQQFTFHGYLPVKQDQLKSQLKKIEVHANGGYTQIFIETPYRNDRMLETIINVCHPSTCLCIAASIDTEKQFIKTMKISDWKKNIPVLKGMPAVFLIGL